MRPTAEQTDRADAKPLHGKREIGKPVMARKRFAHEAERSHIELGRRVWIGRGVRKETIAAELLHEFSAGHIDVAMRGRQIGCAPALDRTCQRAMAIGKKRPTEEARVRHQSPSNTGFCLATNAR